MLSQLVTTWRRRRHHVGVALMSCAVLLGTYILWTSTSGHVDSHGPSDFRWQRSRVDLGEADYPAAGRHQRRSYDVGSIRRTKNASHGDGTAFVSNWLHDFDKTANKRRNRTSLFGKSNLVPGLSRRISTHDDIVKPISVITQTRRRPTEDARTVITHKYEQHREQQEYIGQISTTAAVDDSNLSWYKYRRRRRRWRLQDLRAVESNNLSSRSHQPPLRSAASSANISQNSGGAARKNDADPLVTPTPIYLVVSIGGKVTESAVEVFREPEVVIRAADADLPPNSRAWNNPSGSGGVVPSEFGPAGGKRSPLLGTLHGGPGNCRVYNVRADIPELADFAAGVDCVDLATSPTVVVCPYPDADDRHLSRPLRTHGVWEPHVVRLFQAALLNDKQLGVYDIGANVGQYSLLAAAMGRRVVAVELHRPNIYRLHKAIKLGRFEDKIVVVENGVSDERETFELEVQDGDPSAVRLSSQDADKFCDEPECPPHATTILLDDLLEVTNFKSAVMKMDVEGYEHRAFTQAAQLLRDVRVSHVFMEWVRMRALYGADVDDTPDKRLVQRMIDTLSSRQYLPYGVTNAPSHALDLRRWYSWPDDIVWVLAGSVEPRRLAELAPEVPSARRIANDRRALWDD